MERIKFFFACTILLVGGCKQNDQEVTPDLTTSLVGRYPVTYLISGNNPAVSGGSPSTSFVEIQRRENNTVSIAVTIADKAVEISDRFDAVVAPEDTKKSGLRLPGLKTLYKVTSNFAGNPAINHLYLYADGTVRGGLGYVNVKKQTVNLAFPY